MINISKSEPKSTWRWIGRLLPIFLACGLLFTPPGRLLTSLSFDVLYLFRPATDPSTLADVVILNMDEDSCQPLQQDPNQNWDRSVHARLVRELKSRGAKVIIFDVLFSEPSADPSADAKLAAAIQSHGNVVLAASLEKSHQPGLPKVLHLIAPTDRLGTNTNWGIVEWPLNEGVNPVIRKLGNEPDYPSLSWQAAEAFGRSPKDRLLPRWMNFYGPAGTLPTVSYHLAFSNSLAADFFAEKAVFVGLGRLITSHGEKSDLHATPLSRWHGGQTSGVEIHATAFLNLIRREWLQEVSPWTEILLLVVMGGLLGFALPRFKPWTGLVVALVAVVLVSIGSISVAWGYYRWFSWLIIVLVQIPCALGFAVLTHAQRLTLDEAMQEKHLERDESLSGLTTSISDPTATQTTVEIPDHTLVRSIGRGAYGEVWLAQDAIGSYHAVKVVYRDSFRSETPFEREFRGMQKYTPISRNHPGWVHVLHVGRNESKRCFYYVMELGDDQTTGQEIDPETYQPRSLATEIRKRRRLPPMECVDLGIALADALDYLHGQLLVHRDIKPSNVIFVHGQPKFTDVGLVTEVSSREHNVSFLGTEGYIAPEGPGTAVADLYSLGKLLYEARTGSDRLAFPAVPESMVEGDEPALERGLEAVIVKACQERPQFRFASAAEMRDELLKLQHS